jgi:hypothetical protein
MVTSRPAARLDAFGTDGKAKLLAEGDGGRNDRRVGIGQQVAHEGWSILEAVERNFFK